MGAAIATVLLILVAMLWSWDKMGFYTYHRDPREYQSARQRLHYLTGALVCALLVVLSLIWTFCIEVSTSPSVTP